MNFPAVESVSAKLKPVSISLSYCECELRGWLIISAPVNSGIPEFTLESNITHHTGHFDRLEIDFSNILLGFIHSKKGQEFANYLSTPPKKWRGYRLKEKYGSLFCRYTGQKRFELLLRKKNVEVGGKIYPPPLFSGSVKIAERRADKTSAAHGTLCLNPGRFLKSQSLRKLLVEGISSLPTWKPRLYRSPDDSIIEEEEFCFDGNDNWMKPFAYNRAGGPKWNIPLLRKYLNGAFEEILREIQRAGKQVQANPSIAEMTYNLKRAEVYWEFSDPDPVSTIHRVLGNLGTIATQQTWRLYKERSREQKEQCVVCGYKLASGVWLYIYAKTNKRIRFELRYSLDKAAKIIGGKHTCSNRPQLIKHLQTLRVDAAERLNAFFAFLREEGIPSKIHVAPSALISRVLNIVGGYSAAHTILEKLIHEKGIPVSENSPLKKHLHKLVRHKMIQCRNRVYRLTRDYRNAADALEQADLLSITFPKCRDRTRRKVREGV